MDDALLIDHGSLYPALQRLERAGLISSDWGTSENNRRARFYKLTRAGRARLVVETNKWEKMVRAVGRVLRPGAAAGSMRIPGWLRWRTERELDEEIDSPIPEIY